MKSALFLALGLGLLAAPALRAAEPAAESPLNGRVVNDTYFSPTKAFKVVVPVLPELGGSISDTENVVTFEDNFNVHISIAAFPQDATQRWELSTRGPKDYLIYFFTSFVMPDFMQRYEGASVESARFIPALNDGTLLTYTLLPGGSMFADRAALPCPQPAITKYMATMERSKKTKNTSRSAAANSPSETHSRKRNSAAWARGRSWSPRA